MSEGPKRLSDEPVTADPALAARLRSDLRVAQDAPSGYDVEGGLARLSAAIAAGPAGGGHGTGGAPPNAGPGPGAAGPGASGLAGSGAVATTGAIGVKASLLGLVALGAIGGAVAVGSATKAPARPSAAATVTLSAPIASSPSSIAAPSPPSAGSEEAASAGSIAAPPAAVSRGTASAASSAGGTIKPEMDQLAEARKALTSDPERALALAEQGHARFPRGVFWQERESLAIHALVKLGRTSEAKARAHAFVERHPESPMAEGLRALTEGN